MLPIREKKTTAKMSTESSSEEEEDDGEGQEEQSLISWMIRGSLCVFTSIQDGEVLWRARDEGPARERGGAKRREILSTCPRAGCSSVAESHMQSSQHKEDKFQQNVAFVTQCLHHIQKTIFDVGTPFFLPFLESMISVDFKDLGHCLNPL
ncbi:hypothetical protein C0J52_26852 [Blattella germanica]|nr:hypothetical protein C0J52_26852 [Blattella germanica]